MDKKKNKGKEKKVDDLHILKKDIRHKAVIFEENGISVRYKLIQHHEFKDFIINLRTLLEANRPAIDNSVFDVEIERANKDLLSLKIISNSLYMVGFYNGKKLWDTAQSRKESLFRESSLLGFGDNYKDFAKGGIGRIELGYWKFVKAVDCLIDGNDIRGHVDEWKSAYATIVVTVAESCRFEWLLDDIDQAMKNKNDIGKGSIAWDYVYALNNWQNLSKLATQYDPSIPQTSQQVQDEKDIKKNRDVKKILDTNHNKAAFELVKVLCLSRTSEHASEHESHFEDLKGKASSSSRRK